LAASARFYKKEKRKKKGGGWRLKGECMKAEESRCKYKIK
jgi:hypothetical protein